MHMPETWNQAAAIAVTNIFSQVRTNPKITLNDLRTELETFITNLYDAPAGYERACVHWSNIGANSIELAHKRSQQLTVVEVTETLIRKQRDYGPENIRRFGRQGLMVRMHDKIARQENLTATGHTPSNESIADTYLDIVGYSAIGIMWERREFLLPLTN
jgi:hypothetical protein